MSISWRRASRPRRSLGCAALQCPGPDDRLTQVDFGTSTPELVTGVQAAPVGRPEIAIGDVLGSTRGEGALMSGGHRAYIAQIVANV